MWGAIAFGVGGAIAQALTCQFAISGMLGSAIAKRSVGIAFWYCNYGISNTMTPGSPILN